MAENHASKHLMKAGLTLDDLGGIPLPFEMSNAVGIVCVKKFGVSHFARIVMNHKGIPEEHFQRVKSRCQVLVKKLKNTVNNIQTKRCTIDEKKENISSLYAEKFNLPYSDLVKSRFEDGGAGPSSARPDTHAQDRQDLIRKLHSTRKRECRAKNSLRLKVSSAKSMKREITHLRQRLCWYRHENAQLKTRVEYTESVISRSASEVTVKKSGGFSPEMRLCIVELKSLGVSDSNVGYCIAAVARMLGQTMNALPSRSTVARTYFAGRALADEQLRNLVTQAIGNEEDITMGSDETTKKTQKLQCLTVMNPQDRNRGLLGV